MLSVVFNLAPNTIAGNSSEFGTRNWSGQQICYGDCCHNHSIYHQVDPVENDEQMDDVQFR